MEDWSKPPPKDNVQYVVNKYQEWKDQYKLLFLTPFHANCCPCNAVNALNQTFESLGSDTKIADTFFDIDVANIIKQWRLWDKNRQNQFIAAIRRLNPSLFSQVFNCQFYPDSLCTDTQGTNC